MAARLAPLLCVSYHRTTNITERINVAARGEVTNREVVV
jgi:hypothetical protein